MTRPPSPIGLGVVAIVPALLLTGCPLSDDYFLDASQADSQPRGDTTAISGAGANATMASVAGGTASGGEPDAGAEPDAGGRSAGGSGTVDDASAQGGQAGSAVTQGRCDVPCNAGRNCEGDICESGWIPMATPSGFPAREAAAYASVGDRLFVWGGLSETGSALNSGALYDPATDSWELIANDQHTPTPRFFATAVWTGTVVIVAGGMAALDAEPLDNGAIYDPEQNAWRPLNAGMQPRIAPVGVATDDLALFWGGWGDLYDPIGGLDVYDLASDRWRSVSEGDDPGSLNHSAWASGEITFWVFGGLDSDGVVTDRSSYYSVNDERWKEYASGPSPRWGAFGAFVGVHFYVWGGHDDNESLDTGSFYSLASSDWDLMERSGAPSARYAAHRESGWSFEGNDERIIIVGGLETEGTYLRDGGVYDTRRDSWDSIEPWRSGEEHAFGAAGWVAGEVIVWGGRDGSSLSSNGDRWLPPD